MHPDPATLHPRARTRLGRQGQHRRDSQQGYQYAFKHRVETGEVKVQACSLQRSHADLVSATAALSYQDWVVWQPVRHACWNVAYCEAFPKSEWPEDAGHSSFIRSSKSQRLDIRRLQALWAFLRFEAYLLVFLQRFETLGLNFGKMREKVVTTAVWCDESKPLCIVEPFHSTGRHLQIFLKKRVSFGWATHRDLANDGAKVLPRKSTGWQSLSVRSLRTSREHLAILRSSLWIARTVV
jgi:hypothetical protein